MLQILRIFAVPRRSRKCARTATSRVAPGPRLALDLAADGSHMRPRIIRRLVLAGIALAGLGGVAHCALVAPTRASAASPGGQYSLAELRPIDTWSPPPGSAEPLEKAAADALASPARSARIVPLLRAGS